MPIIVSIGSRRLRTARSRPDTRRLSGRGLGLAAIRGSSIRGDLRPDAGRDAPSAPCAGIAPLGSRALDFLICSSSRFSGGGIERSHSCSVTPTFSWAREPAC